MKLIINADDYGLSTAINAAVIELAKLKALSSTTVMVNMPNADKVSVLQDIKGFGIGLHLNLTEGKPIADPKEIPSLVDRSGEFYPYKTFVRNLFYGRIKKLDMEIELYAQFRLLENLLGRKPDHIDSHQNIHKQYLVAKALLDFGKCNPGLGLRNPQRFFLNAQNPIANIVGQLDRGFSTKQLRAIFINWYFKWLAGRYRSAFALPAGELHHPSHKKLDFLNWIIACTDLPQTDAVFEIPCHPAISSEDLVGTNLTDKRVKEFDVMRSEKFLRALSKFRLLSYQDIKK